MNSAKLKARKLRNKLKKERDKENDKIELNDKNSKELNKKMNYSSSMPFLQVDDSNNNNEEFDPLKYFENKKIHITPKKLNLKNLYNEEDSNLNEKNYHRKLYSVSLPFNRNDFKLDINEILNAKKKFKK